MIRAYQTPAGHLLVIDEHRDDEWLTCDPMHVLEVLP